MRVSPRPLPSFAVDAIAALGGAAVAWTASAIAFRAASASKPVTIAAAALSALAVGAVVAGTTRAKTHAHRPALFVVAALFPIAVVALADDHPAAFALGCIPAAIVGAACTVIVATARSARAHGNLDAPERVATTAGLAAAAFSALGVPLLGWAGVLPLAFGLFLLACVVVREGIRAKWLARVHAGREPGWSIVHESELDTREAVPGATDHPLADAVLTWLESSPDPYRAGRPHVVARVHAKPEALVRAPRARAGKALVAIVTASVLAMAGAAAAHIEMRHPVLHTAADLGAPSCNVARPYFRDRIQEASNVAYATLLTRTEDMTIQPGEGVILVVPRSGELSTEETESILRIARSIPCTGTSVFRVERPAVRTFSIAATVGLEPSADRKVVRAEAERQLHELTDVTATASLAEHVGIGADDHTFGWRARYVLRHVPGVTKATLLVDGSSTDVPLGPRELPAIGSVDLVDAETGDTL